MKQDSIVKKRQEFGFITFLTPNLDKIIKKNNVNYIKSKVTSDREKG